MMQKAGKGPRGAAGSGGLSGARPVARANSVRLAGIGCCPALLDLVLDSPGDSADAVAAGKVDERNPGLFALAQERRSQRSKRTFG